MLEIYSKCHNSPTNLPTGTQLGRWHPIMSPTWPPWCRCHGNGHCLPTAHWTFCSYGRLEAECVNQFRWNSVHNSMLGPQWQSHDQILNFFKLKWRTAAMLENIGIPYNSLSNEPIGTKLGWSHPIVSPTCPPWCGCHGKIKLYPSLTYMYNTMDRRRSCEDFNFATFCSWSTINIMFLIRKTAMISAFIAIIMTGNFATWCTPLFKVFRNLS